MRNKGKMAVVGFESGTLAVVVCLSFDTAVIF
jgi:hypothetical protein